MSAEERIPIVHEELRKVAAQKLAKELPGQNTASYCTGSRSLAAIADLTS